MRQVASGQLQALQVLRVHLQRGLGRVAEQPPQRAGAAHAVPLVAQASRGQAERVAHAGRLGQGLPGCGDEARTPVGCGKDAVRIQARAARAGAARVGPLLRPVGLQRGPGQAGDVQVAPARGLAVFVPDGLGAGLRRVAGVGEQRGLAGAQVPLQPLRQRQRDLPVVPRTAGCGHCRAHAADAALAVGDGAGLFAPGGGGQQQVGVLRGGGGGEGLLHHHKLGALQGAAHGGLVGQALRGVGAGDPQRLDLAVGRGLEHLHRRLAGPRGHRPHAPQPGHFGAVVGVGHVAVRGQQVGQAPHLAPAHGVGLARQAEGAGARLADLPAGQVQVDQRGVLGRAAGALVQALAVQAQRGPARPTLRHALHACEPARCGGNVLRRQAADGGSALGRAVLHHGLQIGKAAGVARDVALVHPALAQHHVQHGVEQHHVAARQQGQEQIGHGRSVGAARIGHDDLHGRVGGARVLDAAKHDGVRPGRVAAGDEQALRVAQVVVAGGRRVGAQRGLVAGHGAAHAQARVGVDVVGADQALGQLVEDVVVLGEQLAAQIEAHRVGAVAVDGGGEALRRGVESRVPVDGVRCLAALRAQLGLQQPGLQCDGPAGGEVQGAALGAQAAEVGGVVGVAAHAGDGVAVGLDDHAAAYAAVGAGGTGFLHGVFSWYFWALGLVVWARVAILFGRGWPGLAPAGEVLFFASPKQSTQKKGDPTGCVPSLRYGQPAVLASSGVSLKLASLKQSRALIRWPLRSSAHPEGNPETGQPIRAIAALGLALRGTLRLRGVMVGLPCSAARGRPRGVAGPGRGGPAPGRPGRRCRLPP